MLMCIRAYVCMMIDMTRPISDDRFEYWQCS